MTTMTVEQAIERADLYREEEDADSVMGRVLADALREAQAAVVQMREDAAKIADGVLDGPLPAGAFAIAVRISKAIRSLPAPAARTYEDGVRDAAKAIRDQAIRTFGKPTTVANGYAEVVESLLSPAPAVAPVAEPVPRASGVTDKELIEGLVERVRTLEGQLPEYVKDDKIIYRECEKGHGRLLVTTWVDRGCPRCEIEALKSAVATVAGWRNLADGTVASGPNMPSFVAPVDASKPRWIVAPPIDFSAEDAPDEKPVAFDAEAFAKALVVELEGPYLAGGDWRFGLARLIERVLDGRGAR